MSESNESKKYLKPPRSNINKSSFESKNIQSTASTMRTFQSVGTNFPGRKLWERPVKVIVPSTHGIAEGDGGERVHKSSTKTEDEELRRRDREIQYLKQKVKELETKCRHEENSRKTEQQRGIKQLESITKKCEYLEKKISEMEKFLADYDLVWVGDKDYSPRKSMYIDGCYEQLVAHIERLNLVAKKDEVQIHRNEKEGKAEFKTTSCVSLEFYKDGMIVSSGPFRSYNELSTISFIRDILDGYFPSELQKQYPQGVPFEIKNHREENYLNDSLDFPGQGYRLGKSTKHPIKSKKPFESRTLSSLRSRILASHNNSCSNRHLQSHINAELNQSKSAETRDIVAMKNLKLHDLRVESNPISIVKRQHSIELPSSRSGSVMSKRSISSKGSYKGSNDHLKMKKSGASLERKNTPPILYQINEPSGTFGELRLKIRSLNGSVVYLVHLSPDEPVSKLYELIESATSKKLPRGYKIVISGYPSKKLKRQNVSLRHCGIVGDSVLHFVND